jgi:nitroreductase
MENPVVEVLEIIKERRSIRKYKTKPVENEKINKVLEAARLAPSANNQQPWHFILVTKPEAKESLRAAFKPERQWLMQAPAIIVACADPKKAWKRNDGEEYWKVDAAIAMQNLVLAATELGLGTCWIAVFNEKAVKKALNMPKHIRVVAMTPLGYPDEDKGPVTDRKTLNEIVHFEKW